VAAAAFVGSRFRPGPWYAALAKPTWNPPNWVFAPVWSVLYVAIAVAGWLYWRNASSGAVLALSLWGAQLVLNASWSWLFFGLHSPALALVDISLLLVAIAFFIVLAHPISTAAAWLFVPYGVWVSFATALNVAIWHLNRSPAT
jgi:tryptophan-rich sensory protein